MAKHLQRELNIIKKRILSLGASVEERVHKVGGIIESRDIYDANRLIKEDVEIDDQEVEIEEECLKILALHQPVAVDLRFLIAIIKINNDLERIADETVNVAERVLTMAKHTDNIDFTIDYSQMVKQVAAMLKGSLDSLINMDTDEAFKIVLQDDVVDEIHRDAYRRVKVAIKEQPDCVTYLINMYLISRHLERIGDHTTNIAEEVIYMIEGEIVRHSEY
jgi:phosphate transport system protein